MKLVVQVVKSASLSVNNKEISNIGKGFSIYVGIESGEKTENLEIMANKIAKLRVFTDQNDKMNLSIKDIKGEILLISQFTLCADTSHGNRPSFFNAEVPQRANALYIDFGKKLENHGIVVKYGVFGADMQIIQHNDGPVTIIF